MSLNILDFSEIKDFDLNNLETLNTDTSYSDINEINDFSIGDEKTSPFAEIDTEDLKRRIKDKVKSFPKVTFLIYAILSLANIILIGYLLFQNKTQSTTTELVKWGLYITSIFIFFINLFIFVLDFDNKKILLLFLSVIQNFFLAISLTIPFLYSETSNNYFILFIMSYFLNTFTFLSSLLPIYYI